ncbi:MAG TPA: hypothetical protein VFU02_24040 [Polyangiaceae bacterium]|nr:hypothetical protein [Polyangiaceae bacterium]
MKVLVIGAGIAGTAAAFQARLRGAEVRVVHDRAGASELTSGAVDSAPWTRRGRATLTPAAEHFLAELGLWTMARDMRIATGAGVVRPAQAADHAILNLTPLGGLTVAVANVERDDWDARLLVRSLSESGWARTTGTRFTSVDVPLLRYGYERRIALHDFAALHDGAERRRWACERLLDAAQPDAWLLGPWLGIDPATALTLSSELGVPVGETTSPPGGPAGARFVRARNTLFEKHAVPVRNGSVQRVLRRGRRWEVLLDGGDLLHADAVVVAVGGVAAGGIVLEPTAQQTSHASFRLSLTAPVDMFIKQKRLENVASAHGFDFAAHGVGVLEHVGARPKPDEEGLYLAGDVMAGRPNTVLAAVEMGVAAADEICCHGGVAGDARV